MPVEVTETTIKNVLTRTTGYLRTVTSHSLQPYKGCTFGNALCGVGCYVQHNRHLTRGRPWGGFLEVRTNAAESYLANCEKEARWARRRGRKAEGGRRKDERSGRCEASHSIDSCGRVPEFSIFCSSSTDPFVPQEFRYRITRSVLEAMLERPPDELVLQTHSHRVTEYLELYRELSRRCRVRIHVSIETDRERLPGLPPHASPVERRFAACRQLKEAGLAPVVTVSPLLPIDDPERFFSRIAGVAEAVVIDHFIEGDGSADGSRTQRTPLPDAMRAVSPESVTLAYRDRMVETARRHLPGRVGVNISGFAGQYT